MGYTTAACEYQQRDDANKVKRHPKTSNKVTLEINVIKLMSKYWSTDGYRACHELQCIITIFVIQ